MKLTAVAAIVTSGITLSAQQPSLDAVLMRLGRYIANYDTQLATVVAEETYEQTLDDTYGPADRQARPLNPNRRTRVVRSDYAVTPTSDGWVGYRDTFEVDGKAIRDHDLRLQELLTSGALAQAQRIADQNARYNIGVDLLTRNINVPTFALQLLHPINRDRFSFAHKGDETIDGRRGWVVEFRERQKPTIVRTPTGRDQAAHGSVVVDPDTGAVLRTMVEFAQVEGRITVTYAAVPGIEALVPVRMVERYARGGRVLGGDATYSNFRQFQTSGRVIVP